MRRQKEPEIDLRPRNNLLKLWAALLLGGLIVARLLPDPGGSILGTVGRMGSSLALVVIGILAWLQVSETSRRYSLFIAVGMFLGTVGDFFNANLLTFIPKIQPTLGAIIAFGIGHVVYMKGMFDVLRNFTDLKSFKIVISILFWQVAAVVGWYGIVYLAPEPTSLLWPALGYTMLLAGTAGLATAIAMHRKSVWPLALGAALFLISDLILAVGLFRGSFPFRSEAVWLTYGPGQMLIVASTWLVDRFCKK